MFHPWVGEEKSKGIDWDFGIVWVPGGMSHPSP